ncbi:MAG: tetratricopeptide repeat protein [Ignavibacteriaceae bacterium]|nr:tetratricopeptide repeat protein [Ignavibacteriaceae bacterium]
MDEKLTARAKLIYERNNNSPLFLKVADFYLRNNDPKTAISILENGLKIYPNHPLAFILMANAQHLLDNKALSESYLQKASELLNSTRTFEHYKLEFKLPDKRTSPFDSSRGNIFFNSSDDFLLDEEVSDDQLKSVDDNLSQIAEKLINTKFDQNSNISTSETNQHEYTPDKSKLATETFANIFITQGQKSEAIKIYELLILRNPEKKEYYSEKIHQLKSQ